MSGTHFMVLVNEEFEGQVDNRKLTSQSVCFFCFFFIHEMQVSPVEVGVEVICAQDCQCAYCESRNVYLCCTFQHQGISKASKTVKNN